MVNCGWLWSMCTCTLMPWHLWCRYVKSLHITWWHVGYCTVFDFLLSRFLNPSETISTICIFLKTKKANLLKSRFIPTHAIQLHKSPGQHLNRMLINVDLHICVYISMRACWYITYACMPAYVHTHAWICIHAHMRIHTHIHTFVPIHACIHTCVHVHT